MVSIATPKTIDLAIAKINRFHDRSINSVLEIDRICKSSYGFSKITILSIWNKLVTSYSDLDSKLQVKHLLWMLMFFKSYCNELEYCVKVDSCVAVFRERVWYVAHKIAMLDIVSTNLCRKKNINLIYICNSNRFYRLNLKIGLWMIMGVPAKSVLMVQIVPYKSPKILAVDGTPINSRDPVCGMK